MTNIEDIASGLEPAEAVKTLSTQFKLTGDPQFLRGCAMVLDRVVDQPAFFNSLLWSINRQMFLHHGEIDATVRDEIRYQNIATAYFKFIATYAKLGQCGGAPVDRGNVDRVLIVSHQILNFYHSPTKMCFDYAKTLRQAHGVEVMIQNTAILPCQNNCGFDQALIASVNPKTQGIQRVAYQGTNVNLYTAQESGVSPDKIDQCLQIAIAFRPTLVLSQGEFNVVGDLLAKWLPTICLPLSRIDPVSAAHVYVDFAGYYEKLNIVETQLIPHTPLIRKLYGTIPPPAKRKSLVRNDFGLDDAGFVFVIVGTRIKYEIDERFEHVLARILSSADDAQLLLIGEDHFVWRTDEMGQLADRVVCRKFEDDLLAVFEICDCMLNPVRSGGGYTALIAVSVALPVLSLGQCDIGGVLGKSNCCVDLDDMVSRAKRMEQEPDYHRQCVTNTRQLNESIPGFESVMGDLLEIGREAKAAFGSVGPKPKNRCATDQPRVSVLIDLSAGAHLADQTRRDGVAQLLESVERTLANEATSYEILCLDDKCLDREMIDGDRGLSGHLRLVKRDPEEGIDQTMNSLVRATSADILAILDWDTVCLTDHWASRLREVFDNGPRGLGVVGARRLDQHGKVHSRGELLFRPSGYHHIGGCQVKDRVEQADEVDHIGGGLYAIRRETFDDLGGFDWEFGGPLRVDFSIRARLRGWLCHGIPNIEVRHDRDRLVDLAKDPDAVDHIKRRAGFAKKWGFDWVAPDLRAVLHQYADTPLVWDHGVFDAIFQPSRQTDPLAFDQSSFGRFQSDPALQHKINFRIAVTERVIQEVGRPTEAVQVGAGDGLLVHLLAMKGLSIVGVEEDQVAVEFAQQVVGRQSYPASQPKIIHRADRFRLPLNDNVVGMLLLYDCLGRDLNPVGLLHEGRRVVRPNGTMVIVMTQQEHSEPPGAGEHVIEQPNGMRREYRYQWLELVNQIRYTGGWQLITLFDENDSDRDMVLVARKIDEHAVAKPDQQLSGVC